MPTGANVGLGAYLPLPDDPPFGDVPEPPIGPVEYCPVFVPPDGTGTLNGVFVGLWVGLGADGGFIDGLAVGGAGFAAFGFGTAFSTSGAGVTFFCGVVFGWVFTGVFGC